VWQKFLERAPRQLRFTRAGKVLVGIAFASGLAAMNTGNNLLFFGWGMVLAAIVMSGVLSEASLRSLALVPGPQSLNTLGAEGRVGAPCRLPLTLQSRSRFMPAYGLECTVELHTDTAVTHGHVPYQMRLAAHQRHTLHLCWVPRARGLYTLARLVARTAYPFGFFEKSRRLDFAPPQHFWCFPRAVNVAALMQQVAAHLGESPLAQVGHGDEFFSLRPHRQGDDLRKVAWQRSARAGRLLVVENEAVVAREVLVHLQLQLHAGSQQVEHAIATAASLAEALLLQGYVVALRSHGVLVPPTAGGRGRWEHLLALAKLNPRAALSALPGRWQRLPVICLSGVAATGPGSALQLRVPQMQPENTLR
jgi:uncharacterized protein (DUF58 family)